MRRRPLKIPKPVKGQESVWDYPRPPRIEAVSQRVRVELGGRVIADTLGALRLLETACPPVILLPPTDVDASVLVLTARRTLDDWLGITDHYDLRVGDRVRSFAAWSHPDPPPPFRALREYLGFHPARVDACWVGHQRARPIADTDAPGWVTPNLVGPFKGAPGTEDW